MKTYYDILGVPQHATMDAIRRAYKKLALEHHPDRNAGNKQAEEAFKHINEAYRTLSNPEKRFLYNQSLERQVPKPPPGFTYTPPVTPQAPDFKAGDYSNQGKHYEPGANADIRTKSSLNYIIGITLFIIIAAVSLALGFLMNGFAARQHYEQAVFYNTNEDYPRALKELNEALGFDDRYADAYALRADIKLKLSRYESALPDFNIAIRLSEHPADEILIKRAYCRKKIEEQQRIREERNMRTETP